jgi:alpha-ketoglutarate-dependent taurine dioxygenase
LTCQVITELTQDADGIRCRIEIAPHTDGIYSNDAPGVMVLHCHRYDAIGGENVFVDGHAIADRLAGVGPDELSTLRTVDEPSSVNVRSPAAT